MATTWPPARAIKWDDTHRLIPDAYAHHHQPVLAGLADTNDLDDLVALSGATSRRTLVQRGAMPSGIHTDELLFGVPEWQIVNAAFCYPHPLGARFSSATRGAWYAGREIETSLAEVVFHKTVELAETNWFALRVVFADFLADIHGRFHDLRNARDKRARPYLDPHSYVASQALSDRLLAEESLGVVYRSVRRHEGEAVACFRPAVVNNVRRGHRYEIVWDREGKPPTIRQRR